MEPQGRAAPGSRPHRVIGIDLGTTNTCVAHAQGKSARLVPTDKGRLILPSVVGLTAKGDVVVGAVAKDQLVVRPEHTVFGAKRLVGHAFSSARVQQLRDHFAYPIVEGADGLCAIELGGKRLSLPEIQAHVLRQARTMAEQFLGGPVDGAVITVPAHYGGAQRSAVKQAGLLAGLPSPRLVDEPTAAALAYGFGRGLDQTVLVYDLGGGTFDVSVLRIRGTVFEVVGTGGDTFLGGVDFDARLVDHVLSVAQREHGLELVRDAIALQRIRAAAEAAKIDLSLLSHAEVQLAGIASRRGRFLDLQVSLDRSELEELTSDLVARTLALCDRVLEQTGLSVSDIDEVLLVGGQSRMPLVHSQVARHFGRPPRKGVHPDECVALGAALLGDSLGSIDSVTLLDVVSQPISVGLPSGRLRNVIEKNATLPLTRSFRLPVGSEVPLRLEVFQGESELATEAAYLGGCDLPPEAAGLKAEFSLDTECLLTVTLELPERGTVRVELATRDTPEALRSALAEAGVTGQAVAARAPELRRGLLSTIRRLLGGG